MLLQNVASDDKVNEDAVHGSARAQAGLLDHPGAAASAHSEPIYKHPVSSVYTFVGLFHLSTCEAYVSQCVASAVYVLSIQTYAGLHRERPALQNTIRDVTLHAVVQGRYIYIYVYIYMSQKASL